MSAKATGYLSVFDRLSNTETRSSAMKKPVFNKQEHNTSAQSISSASIRSLQSKGTTKTSSSRMSSRSTPVKSSLFDRLASLETYASASKKGKIEDEPAPKSCGKTTNSFFERMASHDTYASKSMKGRMATEDTSTSSMKGKEGKKHTTPKSTRKTSKALFERLTVCDTYASAAMKGKIEPSPNRGPSSPKKTKTITSQGFFDRLSKRETASSRRMKKHGKEENDDTKSVGSWSSKRSFLSRKSAPSSTSKTSGIFSKHLLRRKKSTATQSTSETASMSSKSSMQNSRKSNRHKATVSISKSKYNLSTSSHKSSFSAKSSSSVRSSGSVKSNSSEKSRNTTRSNRSIMSKTSSTSKTRVEKENTKSAGGHTSHYRSSSASTSPYKKSTTSLSSKKVVKKTPPSPRKPVVPLTFESDEELSFGSDDDEVEVDFGSRRPTPKENVIKKEEVFSHENGSATDTQLDNAPVPIPSEPIEPTNDLTTAGGEDPAPLTKEQEQLTEDPALPSQSASEPSSQERAAPQDKLTTIDSEGTDEKNESMLSFDESFDKEDGEELDDLLGKPENDEVDSFQSDNPDDLLDVKEETPHLQEEEKISEDDMDTSNKITKFKILCSDKYHPERGLQELDAASLDLVDALISYESNKFTNEIISVKLIEALFRRDFNDDDHWEIDPASARELDEDEGDGRDLDGRAFQVRQQARLDSDQHYKVAAAKGMITIWPEEHEIRMENYSYYSG